MAATPGPWKQFPPGTIVGHSGQAVIKQEDAFDWVASAVQIANSPNWEANARLIAAAPELLAVLEEYMASSMHSGSLLLRIEAVIKQAKGEA